MQVPHRCTSIRTQHRHFRGDGAARARPLKRAGQSIDRVLPAAESHPGAKRAAYLCRFLTIIRIATDRVYRCGGIAEAGTGCRKRADRVSVQSGRPPARPSLRPVRGFPAVGRENANHWAKAVLAVAFSNVRAIIFTFRGLANRRAAYFTSWWAESGSR